MRLFAPSFQGREAFDAQMRNSYCRALGVAVIPVVLSMALYAEIAGADDAARISRLESEIRLLRTRVDEQQRRIARLEEELKRQAKEPVVVTIPGRREDRIPAASPDQLPWHSPDSWTHVSKGMSEEQVTDVLGQPTSVETFGRYKTLFYRGTVAGSGSVSGHVNLLDDCVLAVSPPAFADR
jgi:Trimerisation motif